MQSNPAFDLNKCARPNILSLVPYSSERDFYTGDDLTLLDCNENALGPSIRTGATFLEPGPGLTIQTALDPATLRLHRYPDPHSIHLRQKICDFRNVSSVPTLSVNNICLGVGSDESIDVLIRAFCVPGKDKILICPPTYGMYEVSAHVNDVGLVRVHLDWDNHFALRAQTICEALSADSSIKIVFICSPGNPTGNLMESSDIIQILQHPTWNGIVVVDEAYGDFAPSGSSWAEKVNNWPNLVVMQTFSKAFGLAGIRLGVTFSQPEISRLLNNLRGPFNMSAPTIALASAALSPDGVAMMEENRARIILQRDRVIKEVEKLPGFAGLLGGLHTNFILVRFRSSSAARPGVADNSLARELQRQLAVQSRILLRDRTGQLGCEGCLRITIGTEEEMDLLLRQMTVILGELYNHESATRE